MRSLGVFTLLFTVLVLLGILTMSTFLGVMYLLKMMLQNLANLITSQSREIRNLTSLAASKDLETFRNLVAIQTTETAPTVSAFSEGNSVPLDDVSMAKRMSEAYAAQGLDPIQATDNPLDDFGGAGVFI